MRTLPALLLLALAACGGGAKAQKTDNTIANETESKTTVEPNASTEADPSDPDRRATRDECVAAVDHVIDIFMASQNPDFRQLGEDLAKDAENTTEQCVAQALKHDIDCAMTALTAEDFGLCPMPGQASTEPPQP